jgi:hypothetical protein
MRATRKLDELRRAQKETIRLNTAAKGIGTSKGVRVSGSIITISPPNQSA